MFEKKQITQKKGNENRTCWGKKYKQQQFQKKESQNNPFKKQRTKGCKHDIRS
jgi:hypothetical protein